MSLSLRDTFPFQENYYLSLKQINYLIDIETAKEQNNNIPATEITIKDENTLRELQDLSKTIETVNTFIVDMIIPDEAYRIDDLLLKT